MFLSPQKLNVPTNKNEEIPVKNEKAPPPVVVENIKNYDRMYYPEGREVRSI